MASTIPTPRVRRPTFVRKIPAKPPSSQTSAQVLKPAVIKPPEVPQAKLIAKEPELQSILEATSNKFVPPGTTTVGVHFQFATQCCSDEMQHQPNQLVAIAISSSSSDEPAVVLQLASLSRPRVITGLQALLSDSGIVKVMHNVQKAAFWLHQYGLQDVELVNCVDLQLLYEVSVDNSALNATVLQIVTHCCPKPETGLAQSLHSFKSRINSQNSVEWRNIPLTKRLQKALAQTAKLCAQCYEESKLKSLRPKLAGMTTARWEYAVLNHGHRAIWFDPNADYRPRSLECLISSALPLTENSPSIPELELQCDLDPLLSLLPADYCDTILAQENYQSRLVDFCIDTDRIPHAYFGKKNRIKLSKNEECAPKTFIDEFIAKIGGEMKIGNDNRVGMDRQLHRISVMRSKSDEVYGFTIRVGRALRNAACVLTDLLLSERHADKSVLVLGYPGSGKTTLIRDVARCVSETMENVCIIDTSNEIGGDGLVPHACVGWARRMMVKSLEAQASVMVECVQNHTVETLIVDEIGRKAEVLAASTVRQRGPRLIASAHGDFRALMKNPDLKGLVGGSQQVIVGDSAAAQSASKSKLQTQRAGNPIFDVIVELDHVVRGRCRIIWDVAKAVDSVFEGDKHSFETRQWDRNTRGVQVLS